MIQRLKQDNYHRSRFAPLNCSDEARRKMIQNPGVDFIRFDRDLMWSCPDRLKCLTPFPWVDRMDKDRSALTMGVTCRGCRRPDRWENLLWTQRNPANLISAAVQVNLTHRGYIEHFLNCPAAIMWWRQDPHELLNQPLVPSLPEILHFSMIPHESPSKLSRARASLARWMLKLKKIRLTASTRRHE